MGRDGACDLHYLDERTGEEEEEAEREEEKSRLTATGILVQTRKRRVQNQVRRHPSKLAITKFLDVSLEKRGGVEKERKKNDDDTRLQTLFPLIQRSTRTKTGKSWTTTTLAGTTTRRRQKKNTNHGTKLGASNTNNNNNNNIYIKKRQEAILPRTTTHALTNTYCEIPTAKEQKNENHPTPLKLWPT